MTSVEPGNRQNTQPRPGEAAATEAAERAVGIECAVYADPPITELDTNHLALSAVAAAYPVIALAVLAEAAERIADGVRTNNQWGNYDYAPNVKASALSVVAALRSELSGESSLGAGQ